MPPGASVAYSALLLSPALSEAPRTTPLPPLTPNPGIFIDENKMVTKSEAQQRAIDKRYGFIASSVFGEYWDGGKNSVTGGR